MSLPSSTGSVRRLAVRIFAVRGSYQRLVRLPIGPPALSSRSHSSHSGLRPVPCWTFSVLMLFPVRQL